MYLCSSHRRGGIIFTTTIHKSSGTMFLRNIIVLEYTIACTATARPRMFYHEGTVTLTAGLRMTRIKADLNGDPASEHWHSGGRRNKEQT